MLFQGLREQMSVPSTHVDSVGYSWIHPAGRSTSDDCILAHCHARVVFLLFQKPSLLSKAQNTCQLYCKEPPRSLEQQLQEHR